MTKQEAVIYITEHFARTEKEAKSVIQLQKDIFNFSVTWCNGVPRYFCVYRRMWDLQNEKDMDELMEKFEERAKLLFGNFLPEGFFINYDPRGYALKFESKNIPAGIERDWGGYGIICPFPK